ncbi:MAG: hypothetical protein Q9226_007739 [Calogaya cf. arnoldii]
MPASMDELPNEVLLEVIERVTNADIDSFTLTCKTIRSLAAKSLREHQARKRLYATITYGNPAWNDPRTTWVHPTLMLRHLLRNDLFCYPQKLLINDHSYPGAEWDDGRDYDSRDDQSNGSSNEESSDEVSNDSSNEESNDGSDEERNDSSDEESNDNCQSEVSEALRSLSDYFRPSMIPYFQYVNNDEDLTLDTLEEGDIGATLGLLFNLLPNLTALTITDYNKYSDGMGYLTQVFENIILDGNINKKKSEVEQPLSKLKHITFTRSDEGAAGDEWELAIWAPLFYLPSIRSVRAEYLTVGGERFHFPGFCSRIENLVFQSSEVDSTSLNTYLKDIKNLRHFEFHDDKSSTGGLRITPRSIVQKLSAYASHSLQYLEMSEYNFSAQGRRCLVGSLKGFLDLKTIYLEGFMLIEHFDTKKRTISSANTATAGPSCSLSDILPRCIVHVQLLPTDALEVHGVGCDLALAILHDLHVNIAEFLPNLKRIEIFCGVDLHKIKETAIVRKCREAGLEVWDQGGVLN